VEGKKSSRKYLCYFSRMSIIEDAVPRRRRYDNHIPQRVSP
jgi:hypothetical protein